MKLFSKIFAIAAGVALLASCCGGDKCPIKDMPTAQYDSVSYAVGVSLGNMIKNAGISAVNYGQLVKGVKTVLAGNETGMDDMKIGALIDSYLKKLSEVKKEEAVKAQAEFMEKNLKNEGVQKTESGIEYSIVEPGSDLHAAAEDTIEVNYVGKLLDGTEFDSSKEPIKFPLNRVIPGWTEGMQLVGEGGKINLWIPFELAYGERAMGPNLPAFSTLHFYVEVLKVFPAAKEELETK